MSTADLEAAPAAVPARQAFLNAMSQFANSVCIVATDGSAGRDGTCVSSMTSVAADGDKPTLLICLNEKSRVTPKLLTNGRFSVNLLTASEQGIADLFAGRCGGVAEGWFDDPRWMLGETGLPVLNPALASFECSVFQTSFVGTHHIIIGAVEAVYTTQSGTPLIHSQRLYRYLA
ncbi:flavin reductase family protein [Devosia sp. WQ 349]|uniref:flavin reductase family protein n=1 Tax=Devosia sp. WQ 349K1 TaxID=2800329 RepID=UPI0019051FD1|nr:flavin reductase family protein [Devosia sp. WQ 349K1]MBK1795834.1 flavin reductase family protein [Devosia sp. WQ 349K1]